MLLGRLAFGVWHRGSLYRLRRSWENTVTVTVNTKGKPALLATQVDADMKFMFAGAVCAGKPASPAGPVFRLCHVCGVAFYLTSTSANSFYTSECTPSGLMKAVDYPKATLADAISLVVTVAF